MDIWQEVFGKIKASGVIGSMPDVDEMSKIFKLELDVMESSLQNMSNSELESEKKRQIKSEDLINSRPGAMAMSQKRNILTCTAEKKRKSHVYSAGDEEETRYRNAILAKEISEQMKLAKEWSAALSRANTTGRHTFWIKSFG